MSWIQKTVASVRASGSRLLTQVNDEGTGQWWNWLARQSVTENDASEIYDEGRRMGQMDWGRIVVISGKRYCPPVTVNPRIEVWNYNKLPTVPKLSANADTFFPKTNDLVLIALGALGVVGTNYFLSWQNRKRFQAKVANAAATSVRDTVDRAVQGAVDQALQGAVEQAVQGAVHEAVLGAVAQAFHIYQEAIGQLLQNVAENDIGQAVQGAFDQALQGAVEQALQGAVDQAVLGAVAQAFQSAIYQEAIAQALQNAAQNDIGHAWNDPGLLNAAPAQDTVHVRDALVLALQDAVVKAALFNAVRDTIASLRTSDLTTEGVLKARSDAEGLKEKSLQSFLDTFGLVASLPTGELTVNDFLSPSDNKMVEFGISKEYAAKMKEISSPHYVTSLRCPM